MCITSDWADHSQRLRMLGDIMRLTEQFKFESGTNAGVRSWLWWWWWWWWWWLW